MIQLKTGLYFISPNIINDNLIEFGETKVSIISHGNNCAEIGVSSENSYIHEMTICADSLRSAEYIMDLVNSSFTVIESSISFKKERLSSNLLYSMNIIQKYEPDDFTTTNKLQVCLGDDNLYYACKMASKAFNNVNDELAIFKYHLAHEIYPLYALALDPNNDEVTISHLPSEQLKFAYSIIDSYSILEELGLEERANRDNPSTINNGTQWNPSVIADLSKRLLANNIDPHYRIPWLVRGDLKRPFKNELIMADDLCEWSDGEIIRDFNIEIIDAIFEVSFIRDKKCSHGVGERLYDLTIYDLDNAYTLIRNILLQRYKVPIC
ncbi:MAG: hypothetical protein ABRQ23_00165 [Syntrophomonadaceae bacterium]